MPSQLHELLMDKIQYAKLKQLVEAGVNLNDYDPIFEVTPIEVAAKWGSLAAVKLLITHGADVEVKFFGENIFDLAGFNSHEVRTYLSNEQDRLWEKFNDGTTELHAAALSGDLDRYKRVLAARPDLAHKPNQLGKIPSTYAVGPIVDFLKSSEVQQETSVNDLNGKLLLQGLTEEAQARKEHDVEVALEKFKKAIQSFSLVSKTAKNEQSAQAYYYLTLCELELGRIHSKKYNPADTLQKQMADEQAALAHYRQAVEYTNELQLFDKKVKSYLFIERYIGHAAIRLAKIHFHLANDSENHANDAAAMISQLTEAFEYQKKACEIFFKKPQLLEDHTNILARVKNNFLIIFRYITKSVNAFVNDQQDNELAKYTLIMKTLNQFFTEQAATYYTEQSLNSSLIDLSNLNLTVAKNLCKYAEKLLLDSPLQALQAYEESFVLFSKAQEFLKRTAIQSKSTHLKEILTDYVEALAGAARSALQCATLSFCVGLFSETSKQYNLADEYLQKAIAHLETLIEADSDPLLQKKIHEYKDLQHSAQLQALTAELESLKMENMTQKLLIEQQKQEVLKLKTHQVPSISKQQTVLDLSALNSASPQGLDAMTWREDYVNPTQSNSAPSSPVRPSSAGTQSSLVSNSVFSSPLSSFVYVDSDKEDIDYNPTHNALP